MCMYICTTQLSLLHHAIKYVLQLPYPHITLKNQKINFDQCNFVNINIYILKQCFKKSSYDDLKTTMKVNESKYKINPRRRKTFIPCLFKVLKSNQFQISSCCFFLPRKGICGKIQNLIKKTLIASSPTSLLKDILFSKENLASIISKCVFIYTFEIKVATKVWFNKFLILKAAKCNNCL